MTYQEEISIIEKLEALTRIYGSSYSYMRNIRKEIDGNLIEPLESNKKVMDAEKNILSLLDVLCIIGVSLSDNLKKINEKL